MAAPTCPKTYYYGLTLQVSSCWGVGGRERDPEDAENAGPSNSIICIIDPVWCICPVMCFMLGTLFEIGQAMLDGVDFAAFRMLSPSKIDVYFVVSGGFVGPVSGQVQPFLRFFFGYFLAILAPS